MEEMTFSEIAAELNVHRTTVYNWWKLGHFPRWRRKGPGDTSPVLVPREDVAQFAQQNNMVMQVVE